MSREIEAATICERIREAVQNYGQKRQDVGVVVMKGYDKSTIEKFNGYADEDWRAFDDALNELALLAPEPEPSEREIEAGAKALGQNDMPGVSWDRLAEGFQSMYRDQTRLVLLAARAARQAGGES